MKKIFMRAGIAAFIAGILLLAGCEQLVSPSLSPAAKEGNVIITIDDGADAKTLLPTLNFSKYDMLFTPKDGQDPYSGGNVLFENGSKEKSVKLAAGKWSVELWAYVNIPPTGGILAGEYAAAKVTKEFTVKEGDTNEVLIDIRPENTTRNEKGFFSYNVLLPPYNEVASAGLQLYKYPDIIEAGENQALIEAALEEEVNLLDTLIGSGYSGGKFEMPSGYYALVLTIEEAETQSRITKVEIVHVYDMLTTSAGGDSYSFEFDKFPTVTGVIVTPSNVDMTPGEEREFTAEVFGTDEPPEDVTWSIVAPGKDSGTTITASGRLTVAAAETLSSLTVRATSNFDGTKYGEANVMIAQPGANDEYSMMYIVTTQYTTVAQVKAAINNMGGMGSVGFDAEGTNWLLATGNTVESMSEYFSTSMNPDMYLARDEMTGTFEYLINFSENGISAPPDLIEALRNNKDEAPLGIVVAIPANSSAGLPACVMCAMIEKLEGGGGPGDGGDVEPKVTLSGFTNYAGRKGQVFMYRGLMEDIINEWDGNTNEQPDAIIGGKEATIFPSGSADVSISIFGGYSDGNYGVGVWFEGSDESEILYVDNVSFINGRASKNYNEFDRLVIPGGPGDGGGNEGGGTGNGSLAFRGGLPPGVGFGLTIGEESIYTLEDASTVMAMTTNPATGSSGILASDNSVVILPNLASTVPFDPNGTYSVLLLTYDDYTFRVKNGVKFTDGFAEVEYASMTVLSSGMDY